jgi:hypothetical protein
MLCEFGSFNMMEHSRGAIEGSPVQRTIKISATRKKLISVPSLINMGCTHNNSHE